MLFSSYHGKHSRGHLNLFGNLIWCSCLRTFSVLLIFKVQTIHREYNTWITRVDKVLVAFIERTHRLYHSTMVNLLNLYCLMKEKLL